jgi:mandelate racemase
MAGGSNAPGDAAVTAPVIVSLTSRLVDMPLRRPFRLPTMEITRVQLILVDLDCGDRLAGRAYLHAFPASLVPVFRTLLSLIGGMVRGQPLDPRALHRSVLLGLGRYAGFEGLLSSALSGLDMAAWDAYARWQGVPLATALGAQPVRLRAYNSCGLGFSPPEQLADEAIELLEGGFTALKMRVGYPDIRADLAAVRAIRRAIPDSVDLMCDFAQCLDTREAAVERCRALDGEGLYWIEDPLRHDDLEGHALVADAVQTALQTGENFYSPATMRRAAAARAADYFNLDVQHVGGVTPWHAAAQEADGLPVSNHMYPEFSQHLLSAAPNRHWLEWFDWAQDVVATKLQIVDGFLEPATAPGAGLDWDEDAVQRWLVPDS